MTDRFIYLNAPRIPPSHLRNYKLRNTKQCPKLAKKTAKMVQKWSQKRVKLFQNHEKAHFDTAKGAQQILLDLLSRVFQRTGVEGGQMEPKLAPKLHQNRVKNVLEIDNVFWTVFDREFDRFWLVFAYLDLQKT